MKRRLLVVEDDAAMAMALEDRFRSEGYDVLCAADGDEGYEMASEPRWDLIILDVMLPGRDGLEICRDIRAKGVDTPVLMLTARGETIDKVVGLKMGADDYLAKPFEMAELIARVEALLRRHKPPTSQRSLCTFGAFTFDLQKRELKRGEEAIPLTTYEYKLLQFLCEHRGEILDRDTLLNGVWGYEAVPYTRTVDVHVASLRKKLDDSTAQEIIVTVRGLGYKLSV